MSNREAGDVFERVLTDCNFVRDHGFIAVCLIEDDLREIVLRTVATRLCGRYFACQRFRSPSHFTRWLADSLGVRSTKEWLSEWKSLCERLTEDGRIVILDQAHLLTPTCLRTVLDLHKSNNDGLCKRPTAFVLASGAQLLLERIDKVDVDSSFTSYCQYFLPHGVQTKAMRKKLEAIDGLLAPRSLPFA